MTAVVAATEFCRNFATYQRQVQREPIEVRSHDKVTGYYVSPEDYDRMQRILAAARLSPERAAAACQGGDQQRAHGSSARSPE